MTLTHLNSIAGSLSALILFDLLDTFDMVVYSLLLEALFSLDFQAITLSCFPPNFTLTASSQSFFLIPSH